MTSLSLADCVPTGLVEHPRRCGSTISIRATRRARSASLRANTGVEVEAYLALKASQMPLVVVASTGDEAVEARKPERTPALAAQQYAELRHRTVG